MPLPNPELCLLNIYPDGFVISKMPGLYSVSALWKPNSSQLPHRRKTTCAILQWLTGTTYHFALGKISCLTKKYVFHKKKHYKFWGIRNTFWSLLKNNILADDPNFPIFHLNNNNNPITVCLSPSYTLHIKLPLPFIFKTIWSLNEVLKSQTWYWHVELPAWRQMHVW